MSRHEHSAREDDLKASQVINSIRVELRWILNPPSPTTSDKHLCRLIGYEPIRLLASVYARAVERYVQEVTEDSADVCGIKARDGFIKTPATFNSENGKYTANPDYLFGLVE